MVDVVSIAAPSQEEIKGSSREYALLIQLLKLGQQPVDESAFLQLAQKYGDPKAAESFLENTGVSAGAKTLSFASFKDVFKKTGAVAEGAGNCLGYAAQTSSGFLAPWRFDRRAPSESDVSIQIIFCGMCHTDYHMIHGEWNIPYHFPIVPGHEIIGVVTEVGSKATKYTAGDIVGVGVFVWTCQNCDMCHKDAHPHCKKVVKTYNSVDHQGRKTYGGYSTHIAVHNDFVFRIPTNLDPAASAPLLCAGLTVWSPLLRFQLNKPGSKVGVIGMGGLGHMAIKFLKAFGCKVTVFSRTISKEKDARENMGVDEFIISTDSKAMKAAGETLDGLIDCVSAGHDPEPYAKTLKLDGKYILVGMPVERMAFDCFTIVKRRIIFTGSNVGGVKDTQEMLDYCGEKNITSDVEVISADYTNTAMERLLKGDVKYRFVIDVQGSLLNG